MTPAPVTYRCPVCNKPLIVGTFTLKPGEYVQALCKWCKRERRFTT